MKEINIFLTILNGVNVINQTNWTLQDGSPKPSYFYANKLNLTEEGNAKLAVCNSEKKLQYMKLNCINPNQS